MRAALLWRASAEPQRHVAGDYNHQDPECCAQIFVRTGDQRPLVAAILRRSPKRRLAPPSTDPFDRLTDLDSDLRREAESWAASRCEAEWNNRTGHADLGVGWRFWHWDPSNDRDFTGLPINVGVGNPSTQDQWTQELRYAGDIGTLRLSSSALSPSSRDLHTSGSAGAGKGGELLAAQPASPLGKRSRRSLERPALEENDIRLQEYQPGLCTVS